MTGAEAVCALRTHDRVVIQIRNRGLRHGPAGAMQRLAADPELNPSEYYFRTTPEFIASDGKYGWLNRSIFVCTGAREPSRVKNWVWRVA